MMLCNYLASERMSKTGVGDDLQLGSAGGIATVRPDSLTFASYVGNDPVNFTDPLGLQGEPAPTQEDLPINVCGTVRVGGMCVSWRQLELLNQMYGPSQLKPFLSRNIISFDLNWGDPISCPGQMLCAVPLPPPPPQPPCNQKLVRVGQAIEDASTFGMEIGLGWTAAGLATGASGFATGRRELLVAGAGMVAQGTTLLGVASLGAIAGTGIQALGGESASYVAARVTNRILLRNIPIGQTGQRVTGTQVNEAGERAMDAATGGRICS
jgi:hypothetical protein